MITLSSEDGTAFASQVAAAFQFPVTTDVKVPGTLDIKEISSIEAGGFAISALSDFQLKTHR